MPQRAQRMCSKCYAIATHGGLCDAHHASEQKRERERKYSPSNPRLAELRRYFQRKAWTQTRARVLFENPICQHTDCPLLATDVHHKIRADIWVFDMERNFYDLDNLEALCHAHHSKHTAIEVGFAGGKSE